ncbi:hypothetical protein O6H91_01G165700 [Diphasiastrum complanatum]|uniref:Uncharacterized protein n=4 Tax=Diphasiastrum complanatum TaxID=34168 RepID=A0ACC2EYM6_DIPCM|nr:hypothetical protein O6H91_01G165700 [Diphasiastrum complanatum]KAJ7571530.1 hypothetical protein O6H91_01G165700 [Diphasiastrum complanatum]KAJ7571531.1 hypothetical protein O6H91_01G165700 [Diphasiastrum complanatum]KAJ7571532.1 hypothetical protein O6H91_01G165700 [Diphasiastrum complanatum]
MALVHHDISNSESGSADDAWHENTPSYTFPSTVPSIISPSTNGIVRCSKQGKDVSGGHSQKTSSFISKSYSTVKPPGYGVTSCLSELTFGSYFLDLPPVVILEIFSHLDARELGIISCVCSLFRRLASDSNGWKEFYCERWGLPVPCASKPDIHTLPGKSWQELYMAKEARCKALLGRFQMDMLHGHTGAVRAVRLLPPANLVFTAGYDSILRIWNLDEGLPVAWSRSLGETIRAVAVDMGMLAVAGSDAIVRLWSASPDCPHLFDVAGVNPQSTEHCLTGHTGPITCLGLNSSNLYSGSWDMSIRVWERVTYKNILNLLHWDWVWALVPRGRRVLSTAGSDAYTWDVETGKMIRVREVHVGQAYAVEGSHSGQYVITGGEDGAVRMFDDRVSCRHGLVAEWLPHSSAVYSLAFEDPWLVSASGDGSLAMMDARRATRKLLVNGKNELSVKWDRMSKSAILNTADTVQRKLCAFNQCAYSVDVGSDRIVSGGEERTVRIWDFSNALEIEKRVQASRSIRLEQRLRRKQGAAALTTSRAQG